MLDVEEQGIDAIAKEIADRANDGTDGVYLSWDIDSFDPAYAPGTGEPEPNGLTSREGIRMIRLLSKSFDPDRFAMDVVEIAPAYDVSDSSSYNGGITSGLGQRLIIELLAGLSLTKRGLEGGDPVRPHAYHGAGHTYSFGKPVAKIPKRD
jgi:agmatinase